MSQYDRFNEHWKLDSDKIVRIMERITGDHDLAAEFTQEAFARCWETRDRWDDSGPLTQYTILIARRLYLTHLRKKKVHEGFISKFQEHSTATEDTIIILDAVRRAVATLNDRDKAIFIYYFLEDLPVRAIAQLTERSEQKINKAIRRIKDKLQGELNDRRR